MIVIDGFPKNRGKFLKLIEFLKQLIEVCNELGIKPVLNASLAVFVYTKNTEMDVNDIDLLIPESQFSNIIRLLESKGIEYQLKEWHVLRVLKDDLKIEFDSIDYWPKEWGIVLPDNLERVMIHGIAIDILDLPSLTHTYKVGVEKKSSKSDDYQKKHDALSKLLSEINR